MKKILMTLSIAFGLLLTCSACSSIVSKKPSGSSERGNNTIKSPSITSSPSNSQSNENRSGGSSNKEKNIAELQKKGLEIIEGQSFLVELGEFGKVRFVSSQLLDNDKYKLLFFLVDHKGNIVYEFSDFVDNKMWILSELKAVSFKDLNKDGLNEIIVIADYMTGIGKDGAVPFHFSRIYFRKDKGFSNFPKLDTEINDAQKNENIDMVIKFVETKDLNLYK
jgi:hypothetical protein